MLRVLVTGATGRQGGSTIKALLGKDGIETFALSRNPRCSAAVELEQNGVKVLEGDLANLDSLVAALEISQATHVFLVTDFWGSAKQRPQVEVAQGVNMINAVKASNPNIFVLYTSVCDADKVPHKLQHFHSKARIEAHMAEKLSHWCSLRPTHFLDNFDDPSIKNLLTKGSVKMLNRAGTRVKWIATADIGKAAANILASSATYEGKVIELATCEHTGIELAQALSEASGVICKYRELLPRFLLRLLLPDAYYMTAWLETVGYSADPEYGRGLVGSDAMDAKAFFIAKGKWHDGEPFQGHGVSVKPIRVKRWSCW